MTTNNFNFKPAYQLIILLLFALGLNFNTLFSDYTLDDSVVMTSNSLVEKGIKGIPEIFTSNLVDESKGPHANLNQARYRPLSTATFAVEYQLFGKNPVVSHLINVLIFMLLMTLLYFVLQKSIFREQHKYLAFLTCIIYIAHPIHTEVIANVKSRDELITFLFLIISLTLFIRYNQTRSIVKFVFASICFFLALLTRESAITFVAVVPLIMYFFFNRNLKQSLVYAVPLIIVSGVFLFIRYSVTHNNHEPAPLLVLNSPFLYASAGEAFATKTFILLKYISLLIFPHPLSWDYGFNQIPYIKLASFQFVFSFIVLVSLLVYALYTFKQKSLYSFCILYFFVTISLVSNYIVDVGTPLSERFLFQPSLSYCIVLASFYFKLERIPKVITNSILILILGLLSLKTVLRNRVWENNETLDLTDVVTTPNSERTNQYATELYILKGNKEFNIDLKNEYYNNAINYCKRCLEIYPDNPIAIMELGSAYYGLNDYDNTAVYWKKMYKLLPNDPQAKYWVETLSNVFNKQGNGFNNQGKIDDAIRCYKKATELNYDNVEAWYNLGGNYYLKKDSTNADLAWGIVKKLKPNHEFNMDDFSK